MAPKKNMFFQYLPVDLETPKAESESWNASSHWPGHEWKRWVFCLLGWGRPPTMSTGHGGSHQLAVGAGAKIPLVSFSNHLPRFGIVILSSNKELPFKKKKRIYRQLYDIGTWNPNDPCFDWKRPCFEGFNRQNRGQTGSRYIVYR